MAKGSRRMQYCATLAVSLSYLSNSLLGSWVTPVLPILEGADSPIPISSSEGSWIVSIGTLTSLLPALFVPLTVDTIGRKKLLLFTAVPQLGHWLLVGFGNSYGMLLAARVVASLGGGVLSTVGPMYLSEVLEAEIRGSLGIVHTLLANVGTLIIYCMAPYVSIPLTSAICGVAPLLFFGCFFCLPESPYFLLLRGREEDAVNELLRLRCTKNRGDLKEELDMMHRAIQQKHKSKGKFKDLFLQRVHRRTFLLVIGILMFQMSSGAGTIMAYATIVFELSGSSLDSNMCSIIVAVVQVLTTAVSALLVDRVGRRPLIVCTFFGCAVGMAIEGVYFFFENLNGEVPSAFDWVPLTALILCQVSFWLGFGTVFTTVASEIYHVSVKGLALTVHIVIVSIYGFFLQKSFQIVCDDIGPHYAFWFFAVCCLAGTIYTYVLLPETKAKTFAEINDEMDQRLAGRKHSDQLVGK